MTTMEEAPLRIRTASASLPDLMALNSFDDSQGSISPFAEQENLHSFDDEEPLGGPHEKATIQVSISGTAFLVDQRIFHQLKKLPWQKDAEGLFLRTSPDLFEIVLNLLLFKTLPDAKTMSSHDKEELEVMAMLLDLAELAASVTTKVSFRNRRRSFSSASVEKSFSPKSNGKNLLQKSLPEDIEPPTEDNSLVSENADNEKEKEQPPKEAKNKGGLRNSFIKAFSRANKNEATKMIEPTVHDSSDSSDHGSSGEINEQPPTSPSGDDIKQSATINGNTRAGGLRSSFTKVFARVGKTDVSKPAKTGSTQRRLSHEEMLLSYSDIVN